ncbi:hypothetical protein APHWI1_1204 [Anaplasma phagocytophilum str. ApWI1]|uniref:Uncharacterized protein n=1 Tax=Anaplasma phagocytophilum str. ApWI1 TaxID=1359155 RepID=A0A0F3Q134_ANAPH|nr:hypothetical protein APHWEB_0312 [Anaplasma phagocytophilum str. Webster]KJV82930.1 hypothetical protein APHHGE2_0430 [Anaplasma phagocytophilum str. HGE2]KJV85149.1 hypothetical protein APHWI1_1204 [Anaplasma phagocytophilum str. ApWI1]KJV99453.1 hypothetical protein OTSANNIE_0401 [Anaplasma phagocytophilum str. Annie]
MRLSQPLRQLFLSYTHCSTQRLPSAFAWKGSGLTSAS